MATQTVHVISEAKARPTMVAFTTMSAFMNIDHGERSCGSDEIAAEAATDTSSSARAA